MTAPFHPLLLAAAALLTGCGSNCEEACVRMFGTGGDQCGDVYHGSAWEHVLRDCIESCEGATRNKPAESTPDCCLDERYNADSCPEYQACPYFLVEREQAQDWIDCVLETSCETLQADCRIAVY